MAENADRDLARRRLAIALGGDRPFPWQLTALDRFLEGRAPSAVDVPTGLGKTAVMAIWLVARAAGAAVPRRLIYVVDRRAVVDQATTVAEGLRKMVEGDADLKRALNLDIALPISTLRGKHLDNRQWLVDPCAPAIVLGTIDMIGSRLLFQGYGVSNRMQPYHAGLLGSDSLIVLDEAHLTPPFERLIESIAAGRDGRGRSLREDPDLEGIVPPPRFLSLSATGRRREDVLSLSAADRDHPVVARRLTARKRVSIHADVPARELPDELADEAWSLASVPTQAIRCIVFCDSRDAAIKTLSAIDARAKKAGVQIDGQLFVGARRLFEREEAAKWLASRGFLAGTGGRPERPTFVVATSAGEVGVDLDADHMVSDLVAWERMVQRLGRVNRRGEGDATVVVVPEIADDEVLAERRFAVRALFAELPRGEGGAVDASPGAIVEMKARCAKEPQLAAMVERASTPAVLHPPLARATVEAWSMTSLDEHTGRPEVGPWIRGWIDREEPQTTIVWRRYLPITDGGAILRGTELEAFRDAADPHLAERLETETWRAVDWLAKRLRAVVAANSQVEPDLGREERPLRKTDVAAVVLGGSGEPLSVRAEDVATKDQQEDLRRAIVGAILLVDVRVGGLDRGLLSDDSPFATDVTLVDQPERIVPFRVRRSTDPDEPTSPDWRGEARIPVSDSEDDETAWLVVESLVAEAAESEEARSVGATRAQKLDEHQSWTEEAAARIAERLALPDPYARMLRVAACLHDEGKRARRWQQAFRAPAGDAYAKTTSRPNLRILDHYRHELGSLPYAERHERTKALAPPLRELCLHLIAAHHGNARPLLRTDGAEEPPTALAQRAQEIALRFASLEKKWGPWGLAWWEALLRAADQQASRRNDQEGGNRG